MTSPLITRLGTPMSALSPVPGSPMGRPPSQNQKDKTMSTIASLPSQFQQQHEVQIKKHREEYQGLTERLHIEFSASHAKVMVLLPQLRRRYDLEAEEIQHASEDLVQKHLNRISALRQEYAMLAKELQRRHLEQQQRRCYSGASADIDGCEAAIAAGLAASNELANETNRSPLPSSTVKKTVSLPVDSSQIDSPTKQASSQRLLRGAGASGAPTAATSVSAVGMNSSGPVAVPGGYNPNFSNEFNRLEITHDRAVNTLVRNHEQCIESRVQAVEDWDARHVECLDDMRVLQQDFLGKLEEASNQLTVFQDGMHESILQVQSDFTANEERYRRLLEALFTQASGKLHQLLVDYCGGGSNGSGGVTASAAASIGRDPPRDDAQVQEFQTAFLRHASGLRAEFLMQLEAHETAVRALLSHLAPRLRNLQADHSSGVGSHERSLSSLLIAYDAQQSALSVEYDSTESGHRNELAAIRGQHLQSLSGVRETYLGELAGLMEEYRNRVAELKQAFMLKHEVSLLEI